MGKSSKKIKSDRINTLRKQYDSFLEGDKKRKERNEYILEKLDKMRYSTAMVPLRYKPTMTPDYATYDGVEQRQETPLRCDLQLSRTNQTQTAPDIQLGNVSEAFLIQEISKKYILIPKLRSAPTNFYTNDAKNYLHSKEHIVEANLIKHENIDWKSKYEILNILKKEEKEPTYFEENSLLEKQEKDLHLNENVPTINKPKADIHRDSEIGQKYRDELKPEKDISENLNYEFPPICDKYDTIKDEKNNCDDSNQIINKNWQNEKNAPITSAGVLNDTINEISSQLQDTNMGHNDSDTLCPSQHEQNIETKPKFDKNIAIENSEQNVDNSGSQYQVDPPPQSLQEQDFTKDDNTSNTSNMDNIVPPFIESQNFVGGVKTSRTAEPDAAISNTEYPIEIINVQEFTPNDQVNEIVNINPVEYIKPQNDLETPDQEITQIVETEYAQNTVITVAIEDFEAEQQNMFYSEQTNESHGYKEGTDNVYNQEYAQDGSHQQNEEYVYYEGTQPEVHQPVEINEHEETTQQYDQNYEQHYVGSYDQGYEQQAYQEEAGQYQETENYPSQSEIEEMHYQQQNVDTVENVQQALDSEQGYAEMPSTEQTNEIETAASPLKQGDETLEET